MFFLTFTGDILVFIAGGALVWFSKDKLVSLFTSTEAALAKAKADVAALEAKANAVAAAVKK